ncbi:MAG: flagellar basal-body rod protein FlgF [Zymomonas mobilis]|uniref:flagellar basal-body rod protein FlgF n=1 Tax=Zymomonas mobilis TaxID=542 RepID=UPI0039EAC636
MDRLLYTSLSGMRATMRQQIATASNLSNTETPGFKKELSTQAAFWLRGGNSSRAMASQGIYSADLQKAEVQQTGRDLDLAMGGDSMIAVQAEDGSEAYTRRGDLQVTNSGVLVNGEGHPLVGERGPITIGAADKITIDKDGTVYVILPGQNPVQPEAIDQIKLVSPSTQPRNRIAKGLDGLFRVVDGGTLNRDLAASVQADSLENSNVEPTQALVDMIQASRSYEQSVKMVATARQLDESSTSLMDIPE